MLTASLNTKVLLHLLWKGIWTGTVLLRMSAVALIKFLKFWGLHLVEGGAYS